PAQLPRRVRRKLGIQVRRGGEVGEADLRNVQVVQRDKLFEQFARGCGYRVRGIHLSCGGPADSPHRHAVSNSLTRAIPSPPLSMSLTMALATTAASASPRSAFMCSGREIPKPAASGRSV